MKRILLLLVLIAVSCKNDKKGQNTDQQNEEAVSAELAYASFGEEIDDRDVLTSSEMMIKYNEMKAGDTLMVKTTGKIQEVCSKKGCWMKLDMGDDQVVRVTFKDYGFFMPLNADGEVIIHGNAYVSETSVDDLKHYAEDAGKSQEEIDAITSPERTFAFVADGVLLKE
jgi:hypothetical protein